MVDVTTLNDLITRFRQTTQANSVSPETVGSLLQKISDILATAGTQANLDTVNSWLEALKTAPQVLTAIAQGSRDPDDIVLNPQTLDIGTGTVTAQPSVRIIRATSKAAGAMTTSHVTALNDATQGIRDLNVSVADINNLISEISQRLLKMWPTSATEPFKAQSPLLCEVIGDSLWVKGYEIYQKAHFVPYLFRFTRRRNRKRKRRLQGEYGPMRKGWHRMGSMQSIHIEGGQVQFSTAPHINWHVRTTQNSANYSPSVQTLVPLYTDANGNVKMPWGKSMVRLVDRKTGKRRMLRFRFAIAYGLPLGQGRAPLLPSMLVSNLAEFSVVYQPRQDTWCFSR